MWAKPGAASVKSAPCLAQVTPSSPQLWPPGYLLKANGHFPCLGRPPHPRFQARRLSLHFHIPDLGLWDSACNHESSCPLEGRKVGTKALVSRRSSMAPFILCHLFRGLQGDLPCWPWLHLLELRHPPVHEESRGGGTG